MNERPQPEHPDYVPPYSPEIENPSRQEPEIESDPGKIEVNPDSSPDSSPPPAPPEISPIE